MCVLCGGRRLPRCCRGGVWCVVCGVWCVVCGVCGVWCVWCAHRDRCGCMRILRMRPSAPACSTPNASFWTGLGSYGAQPSRCTSCVSGARSSLLQGHAALAWRKGCQEGVEPVNAGRAACTQRCPQATCAVSSFVRARSLTASMLGQRSTRLTFCCGSSAVPRLIACALVSSFASPAGMVPEPVIVDQVY